MAVFAEALHYFPKMEEGIKKCAVEGVHYFKETFHKEVEPSVYPAGLCIMLSGTKRIVFDEKSFSYGAGEYVVCSMMMPLKCEIIANHKEPVKGIFVGFSANDIRELVEIMGLKEQVENDKSLPSPIGPSVMSSDFKSSILRFLSCLANEKDAQILGQSMRREVLYRALCGEQSHLLLKLGLKTGPFVEISNIIEMLQDNYNKEIDINGLADKANLSVSSFYRLFRQVTSDTPIQYVKKLRLNRARDLIVLENVKACAAAIEVGYESVSQFTREFKRYFGVTPATLKIS